MDPDNPYGRRSCRQLGLDPDEDYFEELQRTAGLSRRTERALAPLLGEPERRSAVDPRDIFEEERGRLRPEHRARRTIERDDRALSFGDREAFDDPSLFDDDPIPDDPLFDDPLSDIFGHMEEVDFARQQRSPRNLEDELFYEDLEDIVRQSHERRDPHAAFYSAPSRNPLRRSSPRPSRTSAYLPRRNIRQSGAYPRTRRYFGHPMGAPEAHSLVGVAPGGRAGTPMPEAADDTSRLEAAEGLATLERPSRRERRRAESRDRVGRWFEEEH